MQLAHLPRRPHRMAGLALRTLAQILFPFFLTMPAYAQGGNSPWENAVNVLRAAFTGTIATGLSLVAIVVGGLMFA
jgi:type IV secretory pathway VirB2 component (pilin)